MFRHETKRSLTIGVFAAAVLVTFSSVAEATDDA